MASFYTTILALLFILKISKSSGSRILNYVKNFYGEDAFKAVRIFSTTSQKLQKAELDILFLEKCKIYNVFPKFLKFKLYKKCLESTQLYRSWQSKLLVNELHSKRKTVVHLSSKIEAQKSDLEKIFPKICLYSVISSVSCSVKEFRRSTEETHRRKLFKLGIKNELSPCDPDKVIFNFSSVCLCKRTKFLLAFGLDFCLPVYKLDFYKYFLSFEKLIYFLREANCSDFREFRDKIKSISYKYFYNFKSFKIFSAIFKKSDFSLLRSLGSNRDIVVTRPDKGNGVVVLDRTDYVESVTGIVSDSSRFSEITCPVSKFSLKIEDKINNFLRKLKASKVISDSLYRDLYVSGSGPGILYGLPKIHKIDFNTKFQMRPIFAAFNSAAFKISKYLVKILEPLTKNCFTVANSDVFVNDICNVSDANNYFMASFDVENLFTNVPLSETIDICLNSFFLNTDNFLGFSFLIFKTLLENAVKNLFFFLFNGKYCRQIEGLGMGLPQLDPLLPTFLCAITSLYG